MLTYWVYYFANVRNGVFVQTIIVSVVVFVAVVVVPVVVVVVAVVIVGDAVAVVVVVVVAHRDTYVNHPYGKYDSTSGSSIQVCRGYPC